MTEKEYRGGIYKIENLINGKFYIGSTYNLRKRESQHWSKLKLNNHLNKKLQNSYNKYGKSNFKFEVLQYCDIDSLLEMEQFYINKLNPFFNIRLFVESNRGIKTSDETKDKLRKAHKYKGGKSIIALNINGDFIKEYSSISLAVDDLFNPLNKIKKDYLRNKISRILNAHSRKGLKGYTFVYKYLYDKNKDYKVIDNRRKSKIKKEILQYDLNNNLLNKFPSISEASRTLGKGHTSICNNLSGLAKSAYDYIWKYA